MFIGSRIILCEYHDRIMIRELTRAEGAELFLGGSVDGRVSETTAQMERRWDYGSKRLVELFISPLLDLKPCASISLSALPIKGGKT